MIKENGESSERIFFYLIDHTKYRFTLIANCGHPEILVKVTLFVNAEY